MADDRPKGPGEIVWTSPPAFPYQTTPSPGCEGKTHVLAKKNQVWGIETELTAKLETGYVHWKGGNRGWEMHIHAELLEPLEAFREVLRDVYDYPNDIEVSACYRPLGTHIPKSPPDQKGDPCGKIDAPDYKGHWRGKAVDLRTKPIRGHFDIPDEDKNKWNFLDKIGRVVGLKRPYLADEDGVHWTFRDPVGGRLPMIIIEGVTYGGDEWSG